MGRDKHNEGVTGFGALLREWRKARRLSQLELGLEAGISTRHLSFLETGRSTPSRDMVERLCAFLDVPLRERNALLTAAGFAAGYTALDLFDPELAEIRKALERLLERHEPWGAVVLDRHWNVLLANRAVQNMIAAFLGPTALEGEVPFNMMKTLFDPDGMRPYVANYDQLAPAMLARLKRDATVAEADEGSRALYDEVRAMPGVPDPDLPRGTQLPMLALELASPAGTLRLFTAVTTLGTPLDATLQELRLETYFPADDDTERLLQSMA